MQRSLPSDEKPPSIAVIGVGPSDQFALVEAIDRPRIKWSGVVDDLPALGSMYPEVAAVILLDGDGMAPQLIEILDQNAALVSRNAVILQISKPPVRLAVAAMQRGVIDVLVKPLTAVRLDAALKDALTECERRVRGRARWDPRPTV